MKHLAIALCKAQSQLRGAVKDSTNPHFRSNYADLESVWDACRDALTSNGLSVVQFGADAPEGHIAITTMLLHESGETVQGTMTLPIVKRDPQAAGSAITYARRYSLAAMVGVVQVDDDANDAARPAQKQSPKQTPKARLWLASGESKQAIEDLCQANYGHGMDGLTDAKMEELATILEARK
jgi:hypothetical protein